MVIADASGKGMPAALMVAQLQAMLRSEVGNSRDISHILFNVNTQVAESTASENYATLFYGEFDPETCSFHYANAGHNHPILVRADGTHEFLDIGGLIIGAFARMEYKHETVRLNDNDLIFFFTDGLSEAMNEQDQEYGEKRIREYVIDNRHRHPEEIMNGILDDVREFDKTDPPRDDTTVIVIKVCPREI